MNINNQKEWRTEQIVISEISKYDNSAQIIESEEDKYQFYDLLVDSTEKGLKYGVEIKRSEFWRTKTYANYIEQLQQHKDKIKVPILIVSVNESTEEAKIGIVFEWFHGRPLITKNIVLWKSSQENWCKAFKLLAMSVHADTPISVLEDNNLYVMKTLSICVDNNKQRFLSELIYLRKLSQKYHMNPKERKNSQEDLYFKIHGYDNDEFPADSLDNAIYSAVKDKFNNTTIKNKLIVWNTELRDMQLYRECHRGQAHIIIRPNLNDMDEAAITLLSGGFSELPVTLELYSNTEIDMDYFNNQYFEYIENSNGWVGKVIEYREELKTYKKLSDIIG